MYRVEWWDVYVADMLCSLTYSTGVSSTPYTLSPELSTIKSIKYEARVWLVWSFFSVVLDLIDLVAETGIFDW